MRAIRLWSGPCCKASESPGIPRAEAHTGAVSHHNYRGRRWKGGLGRGGTCVLPGRPRLWDPPPGTASRDAGGARREQARAHPARAPRSRDPGSASARAPPPRPPRPTPPAPRTAGQGSPRRRRTRSRATYWPWLSRETPCATQWS